MSSKFARLTLCASLTVLTACTWLRPGSPPAAPEPPPVEVEPDRIRVKGDTLRGRLVRLHPEHVEFETVYGEGTLTIAYGDIEELWSHGDFVIRYGESYETAKGRLVAFEDGDVLVGSEPAPPQRNDDPGLVAAGEELDGLDEAEQVAEVGEPVERVAVADIKRAVREEDFDDSFMTRMRTRYSHWSMDFGLGLIIEEGAVDKNRVNIHWDMERRLAPTRFIFGLDYTFETQQTSTTPDVTTKDEFASIGRLEYELSERYPKAFLFGLAGWEFDKPRGVESRAFPAAGVGYRLFDSERALVQLMGGFGSVLQEYSAGREDYAAGLIGTELRWTLPLDAESTFSLFYMPKLGGSSRDWLLRTRFLLTVPLWDPLTLRFRLTDVNDNNPTPDTGNNKFTTTWGLGLRF